MLSRKMILATIDKIAKQMMGNMLDCQIRMIFLIVFPILLQKGHMVHI